MKPTSLLLLPLSLLFTTTLSLPSNTPRAALATGQYFWTVTNYTEGCSPGGCAYSMTLSTHSSTENEPAFSTTCKGTNVATAYQACEDPAIATREVNGFQNVTLAVRHIYDVGEAQYTIRGNITIKVPEAPTTFDVPQLEISAIA
ncbi:Uncharacterized protein BP5553_01763 [Venustampulla echinocandica]|uniref:Uncharacterized protein n=1 Tax=Venustampulla echinocandica TaxID=2656787 RepID=A0A370U1Y1_9HELO|nr:Uncharacterized protein BP5553_01763 [Venustampulla echinocandica]RDL41784.1 Uncharacterized protein BP5553_01763 [Venustampulla echinocandica]